MAIYRATLAKEVDGTIQYIYPKTVADIVEFDNSSINSENPSMSVQSKLVELNNGLSTLSTHTANTFLSYYTSANINKIFYTAPTVSVRISPTYAKIGTSGNVTLTCTMNRFIPLKTITVNGTSIDDVSTIETSNEVGNRTYTYQTTIAYTGGSNNQTTESYSATITDNAQTQASQSSDNSATASATLTYKYPIYYGATNDGVTVDANSIASSGGGFSEVVNPTYTASNPLTYTVGTNESKRLYVCCKSGSINPANIKTSNGFAAGFEKLTDVDLTIRGTSITTKYDILVSGQLQTKNTSIYW